MHITRALGALVGFSILFGMTTPAAADPNESGFDVRTSRSAYLYMTHPDDATPDRKRLRDRRIRLRYDKPVQVGGNDIVLRFKAPLKKKKLLAFEVIF